MARELGEKSVLILATLEVATEVMTAEDLAVAIGDIEEGAAVRVRALLKSMAGRGLVHSPYRGAWAPGPTSHATEGQPQPVHDEPEPAFEGEPAPMNRAAVRAAVDQAPVKHPSSKGARGHAGARLRFDLIAAICRAEHVEATVHPALAGQITRTVITIYTAQPREGV